MLRRYNSNDIDTIIKLEEATIGSSLGYEMLAANLNNEMNHYYVYELNKNVIGYISIVFDGYIAVIVKQIQKCLNAAIIINIIKNLKNFF